MRLWKGNARSADIWASLLHQKTNELLLHANSLQETWQALESRAKAGGQVLWAHDCWLIIRFTDHFTPGAGAQREQNGRMNVLVHKACSAVREDNVDAPTVLAEELVEAAVRIIR